MTKGKTLVPKGKTLATKGKALLTKEKALVTEGKTLVTKGRPSVDLPTKFFWPFGPQYFLNIPQFFLQTKQKCLVTCLAKEDLGKQKERPW